MAKKVLTEKQKAIRTCNLWTMTPSMKHSMIKSALRKLSMFWKPIQMAKRNAKLDRREVQTGIVYHNPTKTMPYRESTSVMINYYKCACCGKAVPEKTFTFKEKYIKTPNISKLKTFEIKMKNNVDVDHINPVVDIVWETNWHSIIENLLDEDINNYQLLCKSCHKNITNSENKKR